MLNQLAIIPSSNLSIIPQLKGLLLSYELAEKEIKLDLIKKFAALFKKYKSWIDKVNYYILLKDFLKKIYLEHDLFCQLLLINFLYETLRNPEGINELRNFELAAEYISYYRIQLRIELFDPNYSLWQKYDELPAKLLVVIVLILYDPEAISTWMNYIGKLLKENEKDKASLACSFIEKFNIVAFSVDVVRNKNFGEFIELLYKSVEKDIFPAKYFTNLVDYLFKTTQNNDFSKQLASNIVDKLYYFQAKCFLCGIDKNRAIQALESISECDTNIYREACYEMGTYYASIYNQINRDGPEKELICEKAKNYLLKAQQYDHEESESIIKLLEHLGAEKQNVEPQA